MGDSLEARDFALYNGVSNRSRGWKSRRPGDELAQVGLSQYADIRRWDGRARTCLKWDSLSRDSELWFRNGNCFVHLYGRGQSRRGPAFKVPFSTLLASQCHPLIDRFITHDMPTVPDVSDMPGNGILQPMPVPPPLATLDYWSRSHLLGRVDLYIPPPPNATMEQALHYRVAVRNLFAWIFRRPVVGVHLGSALADLYDVMREYRVLGVDNIRDLLSYVDDEGYSAMSGRSDYSLAILHLAESMRYRELYIAAFAHCVGMYNHLYLGTEYQHISSISRKLIRHARLDMDLRLSSAGTMLSNFLEDDLSESHLGLPAPARTHLNRFRAFIKGFYAIRFGSYPPKSIDTRSTIFEPHVYRTLAADFQALYEYLVDETFTVDSVSPPLAQGGICARQCVESFDVHHGFPSLAHPLPLLPEISQQAHGTGSSSIGGAGGSTLSSRRSWLGGKTMDRWLPSRSEKLQPDMHLLAQAAMLKAANKTRADLWRNGLVCAYRQFEEDSVVKLSKADRSTKISMVDARKVRWILIYAVHQTLRNCFTPPPPGVSDIEMVPYHISISTKELPPWNGTDGPVDDPSFLKHRPDLSLSSSSTSAEADSDNLNSNSSTPGRRMSVAEMAAPENAADESEERRGRTSSPMSPVFDIRPDIDYLGLANRSTTPAPNGSAKIEITMLPRSRSLTRGLSQKTALRRSLSLFRGNNGRDSPSAQTPEPLQTADQVEPQQQLPDHTQIPAAPERQGSFPPLVQPRSKLRKAAAASRERMSLPYHEIVVHGYGNGTNPVHLALSTDVVPNTSGTGEEEISKEDALATPSTARSLSTSSTNSNTSTSSAATAATSVTAASDGFFSLECSPVTADEPALAENVRGKVLGGYLTMEPPAIPPRGRSRTYQSSSSAKSRSSSTYSEILNTNHSVPTNVMVPAASNTPPPPPLPVRNSARRRFSVYGGGDEYADVVALSAKSTPLLPSFTEAQRRELWGTAGGLGKQPPVQQRSGGAGLSSPPLRATHASYQQHYQRLDMVKEALLAVQETMELYDMGPMSSVAPSSFATITTTTTTTTSRNPPFRADGDAERRAARNVPLNHRHSSFHDYGAVRGDVQPEWEKFSVGLGGHTAV